jgi:hypothetical protein
MCKLRSSIDYRIEEDMVNKKTTFLDVADVRRFREGNFICKYW